MLPTPRAAAAILLILILSHSVLEGQTPGSSVPGDSVPGSSVPGDSNPGDLKVADSNPTQNPTQKVSKLGPVSVKVRLTPPRPLIGDSVELTIEATAKPEVELLMPDFGEALEQFLILNFKPSPERIDENGNTLAVQRYVLQPRRSGKQAIPPILVEFVDHRPDQKPAPDGEDAYEILTERLEFEVESVVPDAATDELKEILGEIPPPLAPVISRWRWPLGLGLILILFSPFLIRGFLRWRRLARRRSAYDIARNRLDSLLKRGQPEGEGLGPFFVEMSSIIRIYIENRYDLRAPEYTTEEFLEVVADSPDFSEDHQRLLREFLRQADLVKFAGVVPSTSDIDRSVELARKFLDDTREDAPLIDEPDVPSDAPSSPRDASPRDEERARV
jgi:hypothetical protein